MYVYQRQATLYRGIATLVTLALVLWVMGAHMFTNEVMAVNLTSVSDTLTDSAPSEASVHTIAFTVPNGILVSGIFTVDFPSGFDLSGLDADDISMTVGGVATDTAATADANSWGVATGTSFIQFENCSDAACLVGSSTAMVLTIGSTTNTMIINPAATSSYEISIGVSATSTIQDNGQLRVAIVDNVLVTANINTLLNFSISGTSTGAVCNGAPATFGDSTTTTLPFGTLDAGVAKTLCQELRVATNAINGYVTTVEQDHQFESQTGADIDGFADGAWDTTPASWTSPANNVTDEDTWGHWGLTSTDGTTTRAALDEFGSNEWVAASTTPIVIMSHDSVADGVTLGIGRANIGYQVEITALQEAGDDYETTLTYITTPTF